MAQHHLAARHSLCRPAASVALLSSVIVACAGKPASPPRCTIERPRLSTGHLHTEGTRLLDELGRVVFLRGLNAGSRAKWAPYAPFDFRLPAESPLAFDEALRKYLDGAVAMGANVLRVPFSWQALEPVRGQLDQDYLARYDALLDAAWARGIRTIVDFHQDVYAESFCGDGFPAWTIDPAGLPGGVVPAPRHDCPRWFEAYASDPVMAAFDRFWSDGGGVQSDYVAMWRRMLARHRDRPGVIGFELMNEPSQGSADRVTFESTTLTAFHAKMAGVVGAAAPGALVFFDPVGIVSATLVTHLGPPTGKNVVYAPHYYQAGTIFGGTGNDKQIAVDLATLMAPAKRWGVPTFIGEWGAGNEAGDAADYVAAHLDAFDELGLSGTQWEYSISAERWNEEPLGVVFPDGTPRPVAQAWLRPQVRALAGTLVEMSYGGDFGLRYRPSSGGGDDQITEIVWPEASPFAGEVRTLEGGCYSDAGGRSILIRALGAGEVHVVVAAAATARPQ